MTEPVQRACICLQRLDGPHIAECNQRYRIQFFGSWLRIRHEFYNSEGKH